MASARTTLARRLRRQAHWCSRLGSPLYEGLLERAASDVLAGGECWRALAGHEDDPPGSALALRLMGAVHRLVLSGRAPDLAAHYPSTGGDGDLAAAWPCLRAALHDHSTEARRLISLPVQTNEPGRSAALLGGFGEVARNARLPLRLLEVGASAGLNLRFDRYGYRWEGATWGDPSSPVRFEDVFHSASPRLDVPLRVCERRGCDARPVDPSSEHGRLTLLSYVWPDQPARLAVLRAALDLAAELPVAVDRADAGEWTTAALAEPAPGSATVVFHSIVMRYLDAGSTTRFETAINDAADRATWAAPFAWLRMEPAGEQAEVRLTLWPGGEDRLLARAGYHGPPVTWLGQP